MPYLAIAILLGAILVGVPLLDHATESGRGPAAGPAGPAEEPGYGPRTVELSADGRGHFIVETRVNGRLVMMLADTGASAVVLTHDDARRGGYNPGSLTYTVPVATANGTSYVAAITIDRMEVDGILLSDVAAYVTAPRALEHSLLGMSFIGRLSRFSMENGRLLLVE